MSRTLEERLDAIRTAFAGKVDDATKSVMHRATQDLADSGQAERSRAVGATMPSFSATNHGGETVTSTALLQAGPVILTFFRGHW